MKHQIQPNEVGLQAVPGDPTGRRYRLSDWAEVQWAPSIGGVHCLPFLPSWAPRCRNCGRIEGGGTFEAVWQCVVAATKLGHDAWMCNNDPRNGGWIADKEWMDDARKG